MKNINFTHATLALTVNVEFENETITKVMMNDEEVKTSNVQFKVDETAKFCYLEFRNSAKEVIEAVANKKLATVVKIKLSDADYQAYLDFKQEQKDNANHFFNSNPDYLLTLMQFEGRGMFIKCLDEELAAADEIIKFKDTVLRFRSGLVRSNNSSFQYQEGVAKYQVTLAQVKEINEAYDEENRVAREKEKSSDGKVTCWECGRRVYPHELHADGTCGCY